MDDSGKDDRGEKGGSEVNTTGDKRDGCDDNSRPKVGWHKRTPCTHARVGLESTDRGLALIIDGFTKFTERDEYVYHEALVHPAMSIAREPKTVLIIGGGDGLALREVLKWDSVKLVYLVDTDKCVIRIGKELSLNDRSLHDRRVRKVVGDGREFLMKQNRTFDVIIVDVIDPSYDFNALHLFTLSFYELVRSRVNKAFVTVAGEHGSEEARRVYVTVSKVFPYTSAYHVRLPYTGSDRALVLASLNRLFPTSLPEGLKFVNRYFLYQATEGKPFIDSADVITEEYPLRLRYFAGVGLDEDEDLVKGIVLGPQIVGVMNKRVIVVEKGSGDVKSAVPERVYTTDVNVMDKLKVAMAVPLLPLGLFSPVLLGILLNDMNLGLLTLLTFFLSIFGMAVIENKYVYKAEYIDVNCGELEILDDTGKVFGAIREVFD
ncbi:hypothetical protein [Stygiolobus caldivivus]|uniref:Polyamine aminopropyltransferase n=1 Tax=Stygiolobus caldivivus TaxID=2824673 RepID=A0A8D5U5X1_9CREN|nr:hypothetical protein [Stygiolobus caldivivus]BCU69903.1 hypothetical protein KN1_12000 [Stygiolobus caldivivus]